MLFAVHFLPRIIESQLGKCFVIELSSCTQCLIWKFFNHVITSVAFSSLYTHLVLKRFVMFNLLHVIVILMLYFKEVSIMWFMAVYYNQIKKKFNSSASLKGLSYRDRLLNICIYYLLDQGSTYSLS